jgi:hypothetical protein
MSQARRSGLALGGLDALCGDGAGEGRVIQRMHGIELPGRDEREPPVTGFGATYGWSRAAVVVLLPANREVLLVREQERTPEHAGVHGDKPVERVARAQHQTLLTSLRAVRGGRTVAGRYKAVRRPRKCG